MDDRPDPLSVLLDQRLEDRRDLYEITHGLMVLSVASLTILVDSKVIERDAIVARLQEFIDAMPEERSNGLRGLLLQQAIELFRPDGPPADPQRIFRLINGGLNPRGQTHEPLQSDP